MSDQMLGEIRMFAGNFEPSGWAFCDGRILQIAQNSALYSLLGPTFGGNGQTTFALPDLRGRAPIHAGQGPGLTPRSVGQHAGCESVALGTNQLPAHTHGIKASSANGDAATPQNGVWANVVDSQGGGSAAYTAAAPNTTMSPQAVVAVGNNQPHENMPPYLCVNFIIALEGIYPTRS